MSSTQTKPDQEIKTNTIIDGILESKTIEIVKILTVEYDTVKSCSTLMRKVEVFNTDAEKLAADGYKLFGDIHITLIGNVIVYTAIFKKVTNETFSIGPDRET